MIKGIIRGQELTITSPRIAAKTQRMLTAEFEFSTEWDGLVKFLYLYHTTDKTIWRYLIEDDVLTADKMLNLVEGIYEACVWGYDVAESGSELEDLPDIKTARLTTTIERFKVEPTGKIGDEPIPVEPTSIFEQVLAAYERALQKSSQPFAVTRAAEMTNTEALYLYVGNEDGMANGWVYAYLNETWTAVVRYGGGGGGGGDVTKDDVRAWGFAYQSEVPDSAKVREWGFGYKSEVEDVEAELSRFDLFDWTLLADTAYPTGWREGYFGNGTGISYITATWSRTRRYLYRRNQYCVIQADYPVRIHAFTSNASYGDHADNTSKLVWYKESSNGEPIRFKTDDVLYIIVSVRQPLENITADPPKLYWVFPNVPTVSRISADSTGTEIPSAKAVWELFNSVPNAEGVGF